MMTMSCIVHRLLLTVVFLNALPLRAAEPSLRIVNDASNRPAAVEVVAWPIDNLASFANPDAATIDYLRQRLRLYVVNDKGEIQVPDIGGNYQVVDGAVRFTPQFPLRPGMTYRAEFFPPPRRIIDSPAMHSLDIKVPAPPPAPPTRVTAIYPSASTLPENQLRFYVHFSAPMAAGDAYAYVKLVKA